MNPYHFLTFCLGVAVIVIWYLRFDDGQGMPPLLMALAVWLIIPWELLFRRRKKRAPKPIDARSGRSEVRFRFPSAVNTYRLNPYQVLGILPYEISMKGLVSRRDNLTALAKSNHPLRRLPGYCAVAWPGTNGDLTAAEIRQAYSHLEDELSRFDSELFWFSCNGETNGDFDSLTAGDFDGVRARWTAEAETGGDARQAALSLHNLAVLEHALTLANESEALKRDVIPDGQVKAWRKCLDLWQRACANDDYWEHMAGRITGSRDPRLTQTHVRRLRLHFPKLVLQIHYDLALAAVQQGRIPYALQHLEIARNSGFPEQNRRALESQFYEDVAGRQLRTTLRQLADCLTGDGDDIRLTEAIECIERGAPFYHLVREVDLESHAGETIQSFHERAHRLILDPMSEATGHLNRAVNIINAFGDALKQVNQEFAVSSHPILRGELARRRVQDLDQMSSNLFPQLRSALSELRTSRLEFEARLDRVLPSILELCSDEKAKGEMKATMENNKNDLRKRSLEAERYENIVRSQVQQATTALRTWMF